MKRSTVPLAAFATLTVTCLVAGASPALASVVLEDDDTAAVQAAGPSTRAEGFFSPLSLEIDRGQQAWVTQNFIGELDRVDKDGTVTPLASYPGLEIGAVSTRDGNVYYAVNAQDLSTGVLMQWLDGGETTQLADLHAYEVAQNPDQDLEYGFTDLSAECLAHVSPTAMAPAQYTGLIDSHPYASLALNNGIFVADAGANAILKVSYSGGISTVAVLPAQPPVEISAELAVMAGFPACVVGHDYAFEAVPTDVEIGPDGDLYVTTLPGGPEDPSLGGRGSVYRVDPKSGDVERVATGFVGATGLGVSVSTGTIVVAELFGGPEGTGQISVIDPGKDTPRVLLSISSPSAIELRENNLFVTTDSFVPDATGAPQPIGKLTMVPLRHKGNTITVEDSAVDAD